MKGITLIGMPGAGKSTIGKKLAKELGWKFIDLDILIKKRSGKGHADILAAQGDKAFLNLEELYTLELDLADTIFAPGGSIIYSAAAMEKLAEETAVIYLNVPVEEIRRRLGKAIDDRGIVGLKEKGLKRLFEERGALYRRYAHATMDCSGLAKDDIVRLLLNHSRE